MILLPRLALACSKPHQEDVMSKVSKLAQRASELLLAMCVIALMAMLCGCGGGGSSAASTSPPVGGTPPPPPPPPVESVVGVATPSSVSVVTATNTQ
jgi:hypothetical protein